MRPCCRLSTFVLADMDGRLAGKRHLQSSFRMKNGCGGVFRDGHFFINRRWSGGWWDGLTLAV